MAKRKTQNIVAEEENLSSFKELLSLIQEFQKLPLASTVFQFLEQITPYNYTPTEKKEIIKYEYPFLWDYTERYNAALAKLGEHLKEKHAVTKPKESKIILADLERALDKLSNTLTEEKVKSKIVDQLPKGGENEVDDRYIVVEHWGIKMRQLKLNIWKDFNKQMLDQNYLFDDYFDWLYYIFILVGDVVDEFASGYKNKSKPRKRNLDLTASAKYMLQNFITDRWTEFLNLCVHYSKQHTFKNGEDAVVINHIQAKREFHWEGINNSAIPPLSQFVCALKDDGFFSFPKRMRMKIAESFLKFFHLTHGKEEAKYLLKEMKKPKNIYIGFFRVKL